MKNCENVSDDDYYVLQDNPFDFFVAEKLMEKGFSDSLQLKKYINKY